MPADGKLIVIVVGDEAGEEGAQLAQTCSARSATTCRAMALIVAGTRARHDGARLRAHAGACRSARSRSAQFDDPYQVPRVLRALLEAPVAAGVPTPGLVEKVMTTKLLELV